MFLEDFDQSEHGPWSCEWKRLYMSPLRGEDRFEGGAGYTHLTPLG